MEDEVVRKLQDKVYDLDKRVSVMETEFKNLNSSLSLIVVKLENLPDQMLRKFEEVIRLHKAECVKEHKENSDEDDKKKSSFDITRSLITIILILASVLATYYGVKPPTP